MTLRQMQKIMGMPAGGGGEVDNVYVESSNFGLIRIDLESNQFTDSAWPPTGAEYIHFGTYRFEQFGKGIHGQVGTLPVSVPNMDNHRYRCRQVGGDPPDDGLVQFLGIGVWSNWRGGNPGAPLQQDKLASYIHFLNEFGTKSGSFQVQIESPDGSSNIIYDSTYFISITRTP